MYIHIYIYVYIYLYIYICIFIYIYMYPAGPAGVAADGAVADPTLARQMGQLSLACADPTHRLPSFSLALSHTLSFSLSHTHSLSLSLSLCLTLSLSVSLCLSLSHTHALTHWQDLQGWWLMGRWRLTPLVPGRWGSCRSAPSRAERYHKHPQPFREGAITRALNPSPDTINPTPTLKPSPLYPTV